MKIGIVGTSFIAEEFVLASGEVVGIELTAVFSRDIKKANNFSNKFGISKSYDDKNEFLGSDIDFVYIATPNTLHYEWCKIALNSGKNVICEKPIVMNLSELGDLIEIAKSKGLFLFEAMSTIHLPNFYHLASHLKSISPIKMIQMNFSQYSSKYDAFLNGIISSSFNPEFGGGALMDINYYNIYFVISLFGVPKSYEYFANIAENGVDTSGVAVFKYDDLIAVLSAAKDSDSAKRSLIQGENGYIEITSVTNSLGGFSIYSNKNEKLMDVNKQTKHRLYYELQEFYNIYINKDFDKRDFLLSLSKDVISVVENMRVY